MELSDESDDDDDIRVEKIVMSSPARKKTKKAAASEHLGCNLIALQSSPVIWSTDVRSSRLYGQFLTGSNHRTLILISNPDIRSACL